MAEFNTKTRLDYVDIFRGVALFIMAAIQIFDYLSIHSIYTDAPYYVQTINSVTWVPPSLLFTFVSGMSVFLLSKKLIEKKGLTYLAAWKEVIKRYGKYVLISLPFTAFMWDIGRYWGWQEAIQGIGLAAIFTSLFLMGITKLRMNKKAYLIIISAIVLCAFLQYQLPIYIRDSGIESEYPYHTQMGDGFNVFVMSVLLNAFVRGWFSVINLLPMMLGGVLLLDLIKKGLTPEKIILITFSFLILSVMLHLSGLPIDYYNRSINLTFFAIGQSGLICAVLYYFYKNVKSDKLKPVWNVLKTFGVTAFFVYVTHYLLVIKMLELTGYANLLPDVLAALVTVPLLALVYFVAKKYSQKRQTLPEILRL